ncbi:hypothetical protein ONZ45_g19679 [Pleurotus djamor]|nr:hypothetical protein ONZ45_g19679 [Pleurotus djamor]
MAKPILSSIDANLGSISLGTFAAAVLYGITSLQTFNYFKYKNRDRCQFKSLIFFLWYVVTVLPPCPH